MCYRFIFAMVLQTVLLPIPFNNRILKKYDLHFCIIIFKVSYP